MKSVLFNAEGHRSLMVTVARLESGICKDPGFAPASVIVPVQLVFFVLSASEIRLPLVVKLGRNVVTTRAGVKIMHQSNATLSKKQKLELLNECHPRVFQMIALSFLIAF